MVDWAIRVMLADTILADAVHYSNRTPHASRCNAL
jgi:hypothetical protein